MNHIKDLMDLQEDNPSLCKKVIKTGIAAFDEIYSGLSLGDLILVGGRPGMGKTTFLVNLALQISKSNPLLFISMDLSMGQVSNKFLAAETEIDFSERVDNDIAEEKKKSLGQAQLKLSQHDIYLSECRFADEILNEIKYAIDNFQIKVVFIDYLQLIQQLSSTAEEEDLIDSFLKQLKQICRKYQIVIVVSSQLNRALEKRGGMCWPKLSDLRGSGTIEELADQIIFLYRADYYHINCDEEGNSTLGILELRVAKNNSGPLANINLKWNENFSRIY